MLLSTVWVKGLRTEVRSEGKSRSNILEVGEDMRAVKNKWF